VQQAMPQRSSHAGMSVPLRHWQPDNRVFWEREGGAIAWRNLLLSIPALMLAFAVWGLWSAVVVYLPQVGFAFTTNELFWLAALPALCGAALRALYAFVVPLVGGRRWTVISTASLIVPALGLGIAVQDPSTSYATFVALALLCGLGGGNFASSMSNISFFFPPAHKGFALGLNAGLGNLGVSLVQFVVPLAIAASLFGAPGGEPQLWLKAGEAAGEARPLWLQNAGFVWLPFIAAAALAAALGMDDLATAKASLAEQAVMLRRRNTWRMCWLYLGTFGSFIGFAAGFPLLVDSVFPGVDALHYAWLGPLVAALARPVGGWLADALGGARVTLWTFIVMAAAVGGALVFLPGTGSGGSYHGFLAMFLVLFVASGVGNGSTFDMIPAVFARDAESARARGTPRHASAEAAAAIGLVSAFGAIGGFFIPKSYGTSIALTGTPQAALYTFIVFYLSCVALTWWYYARRNAPYPC
jgi:NNP family nitrate/nitrite transporter-like MFS transporter